MTDHSHSHNHHHHGGASGGQDWVGKNRAHWNKVASTYDSKENQKAFGDLLNKLTAFIQQNVNWMGVPFLDPSSAFEAQTSPSSQKQVRVLDYACGAGTVTAALAGYATEYVGIDLSENMTKEYNNRFSGSSQTDAESLVPAQQLNAYCTVGDLFDPSGAPVEFDDKKFFDFDLAAVSGGFHHFENLELATGRLVERLRPGGVLVIWDLMAWQPLEGDDPALQTIVHHGFDEKTIHRLFQGAGLVDVDIIKMEEPVQFKDGAERTGFLARGKKPEK